MMTLDALLADLRERDAALVVDGDRLHYLGPRLAADDPIRSAIAEYRAMLVQLFTYAPGRRCVSAGCYRLRVGGTKTCAGAHLTLDMPADRVSLEAA